MTDTELAQGYVASSIFFEAFFFFFVKKIKPATRRWARNERWAPNETLSA